MFTPSIKITRMAQGCVLEAYPRYERLGVRIANHAFKLAGSHVEWLTIVKSDGSIVVWQHYPQTRLIGRWKRSETEKLLGRHAGNFTSAEIAGHFREETRRRK
jgi:hypothetical protein